MQNKAVCSYNSWGDLKAGNFQQVRQMFSRYDTVSFIWLVGLEAPQRSLFSLFYSGSVHVGWLRYLKMVWQTGGLIKLNWAAEWTPLHLIMWMVFTFLSGKLCTENSPSSEFSVVVNLTGPGYLWDLQSFDWNWLVSTAVIRQVLTHLPASKHSEWWWEPYYTMKSGWNVKLMQEPYEAI